MSPPPTHTRTRQLSVLCIPRREVTVKPEQNTGKVSGLMGLSEQAAHMRA